jgi:hypothetical protein
MEIKTLTAEKQAQLVRPLPQEAVTPHPTKTYLSSIKSIYVTERLNEVFGVGSWRVEVDKVDQANKMVVVKVRLTIPAYGIDYECYGGNDNSDLGDAYKGATTDALTKIASWLGIGQEVFKGEAGKVLQRATPKKEKKILTEDKLMDADFLQRLVTWVHDHTNGNNIETFILQYYNCDSETMRCIINEYKRNYERDNH